jgi:hypothetical protein
MSEDSKQDPGEVKVLDRRSFTPSGERRAPDAVRTEAPRPPKAPPPAPGAPKGRSDPAVSFDEFARYLAQVAIHQMAAGRDAAGAGPGGGLEEARQTIDILSMLKDKTRGNLTEEEARTLDDLLYHLKIEFSRRAGPAAR